MGHCPFPITGIGYRKHVAFVNDPASFMSFSRRGKNFIDSPPSRHLSNLIIDSQPPDTSGIRRHFFYGDAWPEVPAEILPVTDRGGFTKIKITSRITMTTPNAMAINFATLFVFIFLAQHTLHKGSSFLF